MQKRNIIIIGTAIMIVVLAFAGMNYYQSNHFNANVTINDTKVGKLTADEAIKRLKTAALKNEVYIGKEQILNEEDTKMGFTDEDLPKVREFLKSQQTVLPSSKAINYTLIPKKADQYRSQTLKKLLQDKLISMNKSLKAPQDAQAHLQQGKIMVSKSVNGKQYDVAKLIKAYKKQEYRSEIHLDSIYLQPIKADSPIVKKEEKVLEKLTDRTVEYKVQNKVYSLKGSELITNATVSKDMKVSVDGGDIKNKVSEINSSQSTLNKNFQFKTHSGTVITVKGQTYGWAIDVKKETARIQAAFEKGEKSLDADNIYGVGWSTYGTGYQNTTNNGIGDTYAEVSIAEQRAWIYKNGKLVLTTNVVTGRHDTNEDTNKGLWYIMYKETPSILEGSEAGNPHYSVKVQYWAPFTLGGQGFHDASWRRNWASDAYLKQGSGGCVNTPPSAMKTVYANLSQYEPVVIY